MAEDNTVWVLVRHRRVPWSSDEVIGGPYPTEEDAWKAYRDAMNNREWFATYSVEHRTK